MVHEPETLQKAIRYFSDPDNCLNYLATKRWKDGVPNCPTCGSENVSFVPSRRLWQCKTRHPKAQFSIKVGTIFEDSPIGLDRWLTALWLLANCKNGISSYEIARDLGVSQKSAWHMMHRVRLAVQAGSLGMLSGEVEIDETFIGGKARNMHLRDRRRKISAPGPKGKAVVMGILERAGEVRTFVVPGTWRKYLKPRIQEHVEAGSASFTDELKSYRGLESDYTHQVIDHTVEYVRGNVHTNGMENFWSLHKRGLHGTYVSVEPFHLFRYIDEQAYHFNKRKLTDAERFSIAVEGIVGKRITWNQLTGKLRDNQASVN